MNFQKNPRPAIGGERLARGVKMEELERRSLYSAALHNSTLTVTAGNAASTITVAMDPANPRELAVTVNGVVNLYNRKQIRQIVILGGPGNDTLRVDDSNGNVTVPVTLSGGAGNDTIVGGSMDALLQGGNGNDVLTAGSGQQTLDGGNGDDRLMGGSSHDLLEGGNGDDLLRAGRGSSQLYGDAGNDTLLGGPGNDTLGGAAEDMPLLVGQPPPASIFTPGYDSVVCGGGNDWVVGGEYEQYHQQQTIVAGTGRDTLDARGNDVIIGRKPTDVVPSEDEYQDPTSGQTRFAVETLAVLNIDINSGGTSRQLNIPMGIGNYNFRGAVYTAALPIITSDPGGTLIHMRDTVNRPFTLKEFFQNWGVSFDSTHIGRYVAGNGHKLIMTVNGHRIDDFENYVIQSRAKLQADGSWLNTRVDRITITYT
jgi:Ca2+-binding RTX toxin-like protein